MSLPRKLLLTLGPPAGLVLLLWLVTYLSTPALGAYAVFLSLPSVVVTGFVFVCHIRGVGRQATILFAYAVLGLSLLIWLDTAQALNHRLGFSIPIVAH